MATALFDTWTDRYDLWFATPIGQLVRWYEAELLLKFLEPQPGERILDVGCGTGIFTADVLKSGAWVTGIDLSASMLSKAILRGPLLSKAILRRHVTPICVPCLLTITVLTGSSP